MAPTPSRFPPIAVVGQSCVLPGALDPRAFFAAILAGRDLLSRAPEGRWGIEPRRILSELAGEGHDVAWSDRGGYVAGFEEVFDPAGFLIPPEEIAGLDPLFHWTLHGVREALRDAGHEGEDPRAGLVMGNLSFPSSSLSRLAESVWRGEGATLDPRNRFMSGLPAHLAARALGLGAGAFALDAACASSLYALKLACDRLHDGSADVMVAGAVNRADDLFIHVGFTALKALSRSGRSRPFHREADGLVPAEGAAFVVLKRLPDAIRAEDEILGVIRGIGLSNDGRGSGLLAPSEEGQLRALRRAYEVSGVAPSAIGLLECHATGTSVGDATEIRSTGATFAGLREVPIGSVKSNLGHLITVAGTAALIKVLGAMRAGVRPPTLHAEDPLPALRDSPFRLVTAPEPWPADGPRRAGLSAFGFGGNNAHVVVEEWDGAPAETAAAVSVPALVDSIAIVGVGVVAADADGAESFQDALFAGVSRCRPQPGGGPAGFAGEIELDAAFVRFPPRDLAQTLPQQLLVLRAAREAIAAAGPLPRERTSVLVGMQCDAEIARYGARWREAERPHDAASLAAARDAFIAPLEAAGVVGTMPNICANRINSQFDLGGASLTVSSEELSGLCALGLAARALRASEIDAAVVGAVDVCCEPVHTRAAAGALGESRATPGDAAVVLVLKRLGDARRDGNLVLALLDDAPSDAADRRLALGEGESGLTPVFGHAHAASGLLHVAAATAYASHRAVAAGGGFGVPVPWITPQPSLEVRVRSFSGEAATLSVSPPPEPRPLLLEPPPRVFVFSGTDRAEALRAAAEGREGREGPARLAIVAASDEELRARIEQAAARDGAALPEGVAFRERPLEGELGFVFTAPAGAYAGMGRELLLAFPGLVGEAVRRSRRFAEACRWIFDRGEGASVEPEAKLWGSSFLCQAHAAFTRGRLALQPRAAIGFSSGETNALYALSAWNDIDEIVRDIAEAGVYSRELAGELDAVRRFRGLPEGQRVGWVSWRLLSSVDRVREALAAEPLAHLTIVNAPGDCVIAGDPLACERVVAAAGRERARPLGYDIAVHCPELGAFRAEWRRIHHRPTRPVPGVRFYTHATCAAYALSDDAVADALTAQASGTVDFPRLIERAWQDGVRVFLEHGPQGGCSRWIQRILGEREHLAVPLDLAGASSLRQAANAAAELLAAGLAVDTSAFAGLAEAAPRARPVEPATPSRTVRYAAHRPRPRVAPTGGAPEAQVPDGVVAMAGAPWLPPVVEGAGAVPAAPSPALAWGASPALARLAEEQARLARVHRSFLAGQAEAHQRFLALRQVAATAAAAAARGATGVAIASAPALASSPVPPNAEAAPLRPSEPQETASPRPRGPRLGREQLEVHASGRISEIFGPLFAQQDGFARQVRMPEPPLLLADRVTGIAGEPGSMGTGTVWTETDVQPGAFYVHDGRMPAGIMIESGQADLLLISWLGVDFLNRGERVYRLLGCELTYHGSLPRPGETLRYDIHVDGHARQGEVRLFFFHYDCRVEGALRLSVRGGQAGFFTDEELAQSGGVLWDAATAPAPAGGRVDPPAVASVPRRLSQADLRAFSEGRARECFGEGFELAETHVMTPRIAAGDMMLMGEVTDLDPKGGPWGRGYLRSVRALSPDDWFYEGHFKNDPCMPGTLMFEGCLQTMAVYLAAMGYTLERDGWRFEPVPDETYKLRCRGQATPFSRELVYEVFVEEAWSGPEPTLYADLLCTVDGVKAFHCRRMGLRLVPDWPLTRRPEALAAHEDSERAVVQAGLRLDYPALLGCAWGRPSEALGPAYAPFDGSRRVPRLPGPPYHFMTRVTRLDGEIGRMRAGTQLEVEYDIPADAWYFAENGDGTMPFSVLLEAALQPCGWLALGTGIPLETAEGLRFRNLDGTGTLRLALRPGSGTLRTEVRLLEVSRSAGMFLVSFDVRSLLGDAVVFEMKTGFGFFPAEALANQVGLPTSDEERAGLRATAPGLDLGALRGAGRAPLPGPRLFMLDRVTGFWPEGGRAGLGRLRGEKDVRPEEWFLKAHFYQDPVQPGSLGLQALVQLLQCFMLERGMDRGLTRPRFEPLALGRPLTWKYRGQVVPSNRLVTTEIEVTGTGTDEAGRFAVADGWLWVDGIRIYGAQGLALRLADGD